MGAEAGGQGGDVKLKTLDGNDVFVDFNIFYQLDPRKAAQVLAENGPGGSYEKHWVRDYGRAIIRYVCGELTTERFYVAEERDKKMRAAEKELNALLEPHGIHVTQISVQSFRYHPEYEKKITEKKLADQEVEQWRSTRAANEESQGRRLQQARQEMENALTRFQGELDQKVEEQRGQADRLKRQAEGYAKRVTLAAEANFHKVKNESIGLGARLEAEAAGTRALRDAMAGDGGRNLVLLEYAKKLAGLKVSGRAVVLEGEVQQFSHSQQQAPAAARGAARAGGRAVAEPKPSSEGGVR
jgi:regulator of protease activity HflC (stomatin/prohibitin superfamily)